MGFEPLGFVLERVYDLLKNEVSILRVDEKRAIEGLQKELQLLESYLKDMDEVQRLATVNHVLQTKVQHLRQILVEIENFLDTVTTQKPQPIRRDFLLQPLKKLKTSCSSLIFSNPLTQKHHLVVKITDLSESLKETLRRTDGYQLPNNKVVYRTRRQTDPGIIDHEIIVGLEEAIGELVAKFVGSEGGHGANLAIVGMGGSGKTTLARQFYNHWEIKQAFPRRGWVCVSQHWNSGSDLLVHQDGETFPNVKLKEFVRKDGSCLVVLDDVWERQALQDILPGLFTGNGRVLITTQKEGIVQFPG